MADDSRLEILIQGADLVRIFDSIKASQDVYVQMQAVYDGGSEKTVVRTPVAANGNLRPRWNERFVCGRGGGAKSIKFQVYIHHTIRSPTLVGEVEFALDSIWDYAKKGYQPIAKELVKGNEQTGILHLTVGIQGSQAAPQAAPQAMPQTAPQVVTQAVPRAAPAAAAGYGQQGVAMPQRYNEQPRYLAEQPRDAGARQGYVNPQRGGYAPAAQPYTAQIPAQDPQQQARVLANGWNPDTPMFPGANVAAPPGDPRRAPPQQGTAPRPPTMLSTPGGAPMAAAPPMGGGATLATPQGGAQQGDWWNSFLARG